MNYLLIAITAYLLNAISVTIDKILLVKKLPNPSLYVFYISLFSLLVLVLAPFTSLPNYQALAIASFSTILWTLGAYFMFKALKDGEASRVVPVIGTLIPIVLLFMQSLSGTVLANEILAVLVLIAGLVFLVFPYFKGKITRIELLLEVVSALLFANSYYLLKMAYDQSNFFSVFVYSRAILIPIVLVIVLVPVLRKRVLGTRHEQPSVNIWSKTGWLLFLGQAAGGTSQMLLTFAISLSTPAIINSIQGVQYVFLFILGLILARKFPEAFRENFSRLNLTGKIIGIILIFLGLWILSFSQLPQEKPETGVTFSARYARELGLNPDEAFDQIVSDLKPQIIRLPVYWDEVEREIDVFDFSKTEEFLKKMEDSNIEVILVVGLKQPRWPECFEPDWTHNLTSKEFDGKVYELVKKEVETFQKYPNIKYWQVENEPFVDFGICPRPNRDRLRDEVAIVKKIDSRPVVVTDSGELSVWVNNFSVGDVFGTTLYRLIWSPIFGSISYPIPPIFYTVKANVSRLLTGNQNKPVMISELQAEPWPNSHLAIVEVPKQKQLELFPIERLNQNYKYAADTNLSPIIFWGVEWWYYMRISGVTDYWEKAREILKN